MSSDRSIAKPSNDRAVLLKGLTVWVMFIFAEVLHGTVRVFWLEPLIGDIKARQISVFTGLAIILAIVIASIRWISQRFNPRTPVKWIGGFMLFFAVFLGGMWISRSLNFIITGKIPQDIIQTGHPTSIFYALDLSLLIPFLVLGAFLLWQRQPWGYVLGAMLMIKCSTYALCLIAMSAFAANAGVPRAWSLAPLWAVFGVASLLATALLLQNLQSTKTRQRNLIT